MQAHEIPDGISAAHLQTNPSFAAFGHTSRPSFGGLRDRQGGSMPPINTSRVNQNTQNGDMQTPGTGYDLSFSALLPSQLLVGSPFASTTPQFQNFPTYPPTSGSAMPVHQANHVGSPIALQQSHLNQLPNAHQHQQQPLSPTIFQAFNTGQGFNSGSAFGHQQTSSQQFPGFNSMVSGSFGNQMHNQSSLLSGTSRTVYLGNIPTDTPAEEILNHVRSGQIESVRLLPEKNCAFISFLDGSSAVHFHSDAILKKLSIRGQDIKVGWGKPSQVPSSVGLAIQQSGASRNVYLGNVAADVTEEELREDLGKFGPIDTVKIVREKAIGFVHFLSIANAIKAVTQLPQEAKWQPPRRVFYGKDRCAYVSKTQQQNAAQYLGIAPAYAQVLNTADRDLISQALAQQSVAAAAVATAAGGVNNLGNRTVYLGNIHPETTTEEICNVVRGGLLHHIRYIPDKHICFVTFIDPTSAATFFALSNVQGLMIHNRRLKIGWGKHSGALPPAIALAVSGGASRNVYIGNIDETWSEERLRQDFSEYGEIELVNALREKSCAFVNFTNIANAIKAIEGIRGKEEYKRFKINFGKDRCGNPPRQANNGSNGTNRGGQGNGALHSNGTLPYGQNGGQDGFGSPAEAVGGQGSQAGSSTSGISGNGAMNGANGGGNPLTQYLNQLSQQQNFGQSNGAMEKGEGESSVGFGRMAGDGASHYAHHGSSNSFTTSSKMGGLLPAAGTGMSAAAQKSQHSRALSMPAFTHESQLSSARIGALTSGLGGLRLGNGLSVNGYGGGGEMSGLPRWEEEVGS